MNSKTFTEERNKAREINKRRKQERLSGKNEWETKEPNQEKPKADDSQHGKWHEERNTWYLRSSYLNMTPEREYLIFKEKKQITLPLRRLTWCPRSSQLTSLLSLHVCHIFLEVLTSMRPNVHPILWNPKAMFVSEFGSSLVCLAEGVAQNHIFNNDALKDKKKITIHSIVMQILRCKLRWQ